jgi:hypothetical protein
MRGLWQSFENKQSQKVIVGSARTSNKVSIGITFWVLLAGITVSLSSCGSGGGGDESLPLPINFVPSISITFTTTAPSRTSRVSESPGRMPPPVSPDKRSNLFSCARLSSSVTTSGGQPFHWCSAITKSR